MPNDLQVHRRRGLQHRQKQLRPKPLPLLILKIFSLLFPPSEMFYFYKTSRKGICAHQFASCELPSFLYSAHCFASILSSTHYKQVKKTIIILYIIHCLDIFYIIFRIIASYFVKNITNDCIFLYFRIIRCFYQSVAASCLPTKNYFYRLCFYKLLICSCTAVSAGYFQHI